MNNHVLPLYYSAGKFFLQFSHRVSWQLIDEKYLFPAFIAGKLSLQNRMIHRMDIWRILSTCNDRNNRMAGFSAYFRPICHSFWARFIICSQAVPAEHAAFVEKELFIPGLALSRVGSEQNPRLNLTSIILISEMSLFGSLSLSQVHSHFTFQLI